MRVVRPLIGECQAFAFRALDAVHSRTRIQPPTNFQGLSFMTPCPSNPFTTTLVRAAAISAVLASALLAPAAWAQSTDLSACMAELRPAARTGKVSDATWARHTAGLQADFSVIEKLNFLKWTPNSGQVFKWDTV